MLNESSPNLLTAGQRRIVGSALTLFALGGIVALIIGGFYFLGRIAGYFSSVLWPLAMAGVLALILRPLVESFEKWLRLRRPAAVILLYGLFLLLTGGALVLLVPPLVEQVLAFFSYLPALWTSVSGYLGRNFPEWMAFVQHQLDNPAAQRLADAVGEALHGFISQALPSLHDAGAGALGVFGFVANVAIVPVYLFFFLLARGEFQTGLRGHLSFLRESLREDVVFLTNEFLAIIVAFFRGQIVIGLIMGVLLAVGFTFAGLKFGLFLGLAIGLLNIVPYLGTILGLSVVLPLAFFQPGGGWQLMAVVLLINVVVQNIEGWILTPKIIGHHTGLHPVAIIFSIFFWGAAFGGVLGMLFAVPLTAFFVTAWRLAKVKYFQAAH